MEQMMEQDKKYRNKEIAWLLFLNVKMIKSDNLRKSFEKLELKEISWNVQLLKNNIFT